MKPTDPKFLYLILVLPGLFAVALIGDGINKLIHNQARGYIGMTIGLIFFAAIVLFYLYFTFYLF